MQGLNHDQVVVMLLAVATLLGVARILGETAKRFGQPAILGEIGAGILLGPTILGHLWPEANAFLFPTTGHNAIALSSLGTLAVVMFLLVAGMEVDLSMLGRLGKAAIIIGICGLVAPFAMGFGLAQAIPSFMGMEPGADKLVFSLFLGVAMAISALPVIAKTLMDLNLFRSDVGMIVIAVAIVHDLIGWVIFAIILSMMRASGDVTGEGQNIWFTVCLTLVYSGLMLTVGRWLIHRTLPWVQAHSSWPGGVLGFVLVVGILGAAFTEWIGIHAIFGAFMVGVAMGDSSHLRQRTRATIEQFIAFIFAPLFFASIGLRVDFIAHFDWLLVITIFVVACVGETLGCYFGAKWAGFPKRQSWAIGFALNARGAMEIVLATLALQYGVIGEKLFVALVVMALGTSLIAGPMMQWVLRRKQTAKLRKHINPKAFNAGLRRTDRQAVIEELVQSGAGALTGVSKLSPADITTAVWAREQIMTTALPGGLAIPHARLEGLSQPVVYVGIHPKGVDWDAPDGEPTRLILLVLTPQDAQEIQLELLADIAKLFHQPDAINKAVECGSYVEFLALLNTRYVPEHVTPPSSPAPPAPPGAGAPAAS